MYLKAYKHYKYLFDIINVTFDQFNVSLLNNSIHFLKKENLTDTNLVIIGVSFMTLLNN